jgi:cholesterol transport system auxiliary component
MKMDCLSVKRTVGVGLVGFCLASCGPISLVEPPPASDIYDISPEVKLASTGEAADWRLLVGEPLAVRAINTDRVVIKPREHEVRYVKGVRWSDRVPSLLQGKMLEVFEDSGKIGSVARVSSGVPSDFELKAELRDFQVESFGSPSGEAVVSISFKLVRYPSREPIAAKVFEERVGLQSIRMRHVVEGFDLAVGQLFEHALMWVLENGEADRSESPSLATEIDLEDTPDVPEVEDNSDEPVVEEELVETAGETQSLTEMADSTAEE